jgi:hypothetical protein
MYFAFSIPIKALIQDSESLNTLPDQQTRSLLTLNLFWFYKFLLLFAFNQLFRLVNMDGFLNILF